MPTRTICSLHSMVEPIPLRSRRSQVRILSGAPSPQLIEFKLATLAGFVLIPFGLFGKTAFMAERVLGLVISSGVKGAGCHRRRRLNPVRRVSR